MTMNTARTLMRVQFLAARCDGAVARDHAGFNAYDTDWGCELARRGDLTVSEAKHAERVLRKYAKQLEGLEEIMDDYNDQVFDLDTIDESGGGGLPAPVGSHLCRLECESLAAIGNSMGFKIRGTVVETNYRGYVIEDVLWVTDKAMARIKLILHRVAGFESGKVTAAQIRDALNGQLARVTVEKVTYGTSGDKAEYTEAEAAKKRAEGIKMYGHTKIAFNGYESATAEEIAQYSSRAAQNPSSNSAKSSEKLPF